MDCRHPDDLSWQESFVTAIYFFATLVHEFIVHLIAAVYSAVVWHLVRFGNSSIDTAGDLIDIVADMMDLRAEGFDLLRRERANLRPQNEAPEVGGFGKAATSGAVLQQRSFPLGTAVGKSRISSACSLLPRLTAGNFPPAGGIGARGIPPASAQKIILLRYACAIAAEGGGGLAAQGAAIFKR